MEGLGRIASANDAANISLTQHAGIKKWVCLSSNDDGMMRGSCGGVPRHPVTDIIGVGINGDCRLRRNLRRANRAAFRLDPPKPEPHGGKTVDMMVDWLTKGTEPPKATYTSGTAITRDNYKEAMAKEGL